MSTDLTAARERLSHAADGLGTLDLGPGGASVPGSVRWQLAADIRLVLHALDAKEDPRTPSERLRDYYNPPAPSVPAEPDEHVCAEPVAEGKRCADRGYCVCATCKERLYPCDRCGKQRTKAEGGTTFTVCDECWSIAYPKAPRAPSASGTAAEPPTQFFSTPTHVLVPLCPRGCGGVIKDWAARECPSCRRPLTGETPMEEKPDGACWEWFGPADHRMRCRRDAGHSDDHFDHPDSEASGPATVATNGDLIASAPVSPASSVTVNEADVDRAEYMYEHGPHYGPAHPAALRRVLEDYASRHAPAFTQEDVKLVTTAAQREPILKRGDALFALANRIAASIGAEK